MTRSMMTIVCYLNWRVRFRPGLLLRRLQPCPTLDTSTTSTRPRRGRRGRRRDTTSTTPAYAQAQAQSYPNGAPPTRQRTHSYHSTTSHHSTSSSRHKNASAPPNLSINSSSAPPPPPSYSTRQLPSAPSSRQQQPPLPPHLHPVRSSAPLSSSTAYARSSSTSYSHLVGGARSSAPPPATTASDYGMVPTTPSWPAHLAPSRSSTLPPGSLSARSHKSGLSRRRRDLSPTAHADSASESGASVLSAFHHPSRTPRGHQGRSHDRAREQRKALQEQTDSPLRRWTRVTEPALGPIKTLLLAIAFVVLIKCTVGLGEYSGYGVPPLRGDLEAQRHWLSLTSSTLQAPFLHLAPSSYANEVSLPITRWYHHDFDYWRLDYPPLTAYHSLLLGFIARLSPRTAEYVTWRPPSDAPLEMLQGWEKNMVALEQKGEMKAWMRMTVIIGDLLVYVSAVIVYCSRNYAKKESSSKRARPVIVATLSILLQPALILIDNGHFQYNSLMLGMTLWSLNFFQSGHDLLGAIAFVCALGFKQMALYYSPAIFAYLLGKCFYLGGRRGASLFINLGFVTLSTFALLLSPFLSNPSEIVQIVSRIFPFSRGLFEDKVANFWCAINVVVKLRQIASIPTLARLALLLTLVAVLPSVIGLLWISHEVGKRRRDEEREAKTIKSTSTTEIDSDEDKTPTFILLPHTLFISAMAFFLFSFQVHEKSILLPLMPLTMLMGGREAGFGRMDWEWGVLLNNVGVFSMWPLLKRDGVGLAYFALTIGWNYAIGYNPIVLRRSFVKYLSITSYALIGLLHTIQLIASPPVHLPDLFVVMNLTLSCGVFGLGFLWASKRSVQEGWAVVGMK